MPALELVDETFIVADRQVLAAVVHDEETWSLWWPDLRLHPFMDRGVDGIRWSATGARWQGSLEVWLELVGDGVLVHHYQRLDPVPGDRGVSAQALARERARRTRAWKRHVFELKDRLEQDRRPGSAIHPDGSRSLSGLPREQG